jgi:hypothetical protein
MLLSSSRSSIQGISVELDIIWTHFAVYPSIAAGDTFLVVYCAKGLQITSLVDSGGSRDAAVLGPAASPWTICFCVSCSSNSGPGRVAYKLESASSSDVSKCSMV